MGGAVDTERQAQHRMWQVVSQMDQRGHQPVEEDQLVAGPGALGALADSAPCSMTAAFKTSLPWRRQLLDQAGEMMLRDPREQLMRRHRPIDHDHHKRIMSPARHNASPALTHQLVRTSPLTRWDTLSGSAPGRVGLRMRGSYLLRVRDGTRHDTGGTIGTMSQPKAMNLRFPDPAQRAAIEAAARQEGVSLQEYILSAAYARATAVETHFLEAFRASMARSGDAFAEAAGADGEHRAEELAARRDLEKQQERGHAA